MEEPGRSRVRGLLSKALQFRNATVPRANMPLSISFLSHDDFQINVERWLRNIIVNLKDMALPLFLPTRHLREAAYPKVREFLHNHRKAETWWDATDPEKLPCCCSFLRLHCTYDVDPQQHLAVNLEDLKLPKFLAVFSDANANSTYYLSKTSFLERVQPKFQQWLRHHGLPPSLSTPFQQFMHDQWKLHLQSLDHHPRLTFRDVQSLLRWLPYNCVLHHGDHEQFRITVFCPKLYFHGALQTWLDKELFEKLPFSIDDAQTLIHRAFSKRLIRRYPWGFRKGALLPYGFVFLKRKKQWAKGRTLISYYKSYQAKLLKATSRALDSICRQVWSQDLGQLSTPQIWSKVHAYFDATDEAARLQFVNDDLVGFFNSVPQTRLLDAVHQLVDHWVENHLGHFPEGRDSITISVDTSAHGDPVHSTFSGSFRRTAFQIRKLHVADIVEIVQSSLSSHIFSALGCIWRQIRGAGIGSQISPSLSNLAVTITERSWQETFAQVLEQPSLHLCSIRYADNRFLMFSTNFNSCDALTTFCDLDFYGHPVELEKVEDNMLLGFAVDVDRRTVEYRQPDIRQIRDCISAGSLRLRMSGLKSRAHLIRKYTYPTSLISSSLTQLGALYVQKGFSQPDVDQALNQRK